MSIRPADLNNFLSSRSYIDGYVPSQADVAVIEHMGSDCVDTSLFHLMRWQRHIRSYSANDQLAFPGIKKDVGEYGINTCGGEDAKGAEGGDDDDDFDLFGDEDQEEVKKQQNELTQKLMREAEERQKKKLAEARSTIVMEVKPYDDETDIGEIEKLVKAVQMDGLKWGKSQPVPVAYGLNLLQISAVIYDEKVSTELLCELIEKNDEIIQSADIVSFQKFS